MVGKSKSNCEIQNMKNDSTLLLRDRRFVAVTKNGKSWE